LKLNTWIRSSTTRMMRWLHLSNIEFWYFQNNRRLMIDQSLSRYQLFVLGLFFGFTVIMLGIILILFLETHFTLHQEFIFRDIFPLFTSTILIAFYIWVQGWNAYCWTKLNINYKLIFEFGLHYSPPSQVHIYISI
jgi:hypothetical protein